MSPAKAREAFIKLTAVQSIVSDIVSSYEGKDIHGRSLNELGWRSIMNYTITYMLNKSDKEAPYCKKSPLKEQCQPIGLDTRKKMKIKVDYVAFENTIELPLNSVEGIENKKENNHVD